MIRLNILGEEQTEETFVQSDIGHPRFLPYLQLHEFESLLLAAPCQFDWAFIQQDQARERLLTWVAPFSSPELIDDGKETAPSKRILQAIPEYEGQKASAGPLIAEKIGLTVLRARCPHFHAWRKKMEQLGLSEALEEPT